MAKFEIKLPQMGESVAEATITAWLKNIGDKIEQDEAIVEIATDKVDTEIPSEVEGTLLEIRFEVDALVQVGDTIAIIDTSGPSEDRGVEGESIEVPIDVVDMVDYDIKNLIEKSSENDGYISKNFFSPLVKNIALKEGVSLEELDAIIGTGKDARVTKNDILSYIQSKEKVETQKNDLKSTAPESFSQIKDVLKATPINSGDEIFEMSRMGKLIANHMIDSVHTSAHVQSFIEVDVTNIVTWRNKIKDSFFKQEGEKITYTPIFMQAIVKAIREFPAINISVEGDKIIKRKAINLGMATALEDGNLIVPVIKNADQLNLVGMTKAVNNLAKRARSGKLNPDDIQGGTYTVTNVGGFGSVFGTPIINQPQVAILALGAVRKVPAVIETPEGDFIGIRHTMFLSHSYDHRVVNGALGGKFIKFIKDNLEAWDIHANF